MTKQEFLDELQRALTNKISAVAVTEHVNYYREYIEVEVRKGKSEEAIVQELGSPRLIAKSILTAAGMEQEQNDGFGGDQTEEGHYEASGWQRKLPMILVLITIMVVLLIVGLLLSSVIRIFLPILLPLVLVIILIRWWRSRR